MATIGHRVITYPFIDSTNNEAWRLLKNETLDEGTLIRAGYQTAGKGQGSTTWESKAGSNLNLSLILRPSFLPASRQFIMNQAVAISLSEAIANFCPDEHVKIKWPNDIYIGLKKVAGILIENSVMGSVMEVSVIGIGVNVNQLSFHSDAANPISLAQVHGKELDLESCLHTICHYFEIWIGHLKNGEEEKIRQQYMNLMLGFGKHQMFMDTSGLFRADIIGVSEYGKLILEHHGIRKEYDNKEIRFIFDAVNEPG